uniref:Uncharacterized protein n=1 Tax=Coccidioides posadasii RMSCC 3488 TaxID=454284 RepID=A0A0J6FK24_COCPO|nr:hypothetical protein CPAG_06074 [Coccidioides posadasii RMSCC 3488]
MHPVSTPNRRSIQQMRRRRKATLKRLLHRYCIECYSQVNLIGAEYVLPRDAPGDWGKKQVAEYFTINFKPQHMPDRDSSRLQEMRYKRKTSLEHKLREYSKNCFSDIYISVSELGTGWTISCQKGWQEESRSYSLSTDADSNSFPPSQEVLDNHYPLVARTTMENYPT